MSQPHHAHRQPTRWLRIGIPVLLVLIWLVGGSIGGPYFGKVDEVSTNDRSSFLPESADATQVNERLPDFLGDESIPAVVVVTGDGALTEAQLADAQTLADDIAEVDGVLDGVSPPIASEDGEAVQIFVPIDATAEVAAIVADIRTLVSDGLPDGMQGWVTGPAGFTADLVDGFLGIDGLLLAVALHRGVRHPDHRLPVAAPAGAGAHDIAVRAVRGAADGLVARVRRASSSSTARCRESCSSWSSARPPTTRCCMSPASVRPSPPGRGDGTPPSRRGGGHSSRSSPRAAQ